MSLLKSYFTEGFYDELFESDGVPRQDILPLIEQLNGLSMKQLKRMQKAAEADLFESGITFNVKTHKEGIEKIFPFDILPRIIQANEWAHLEQGLTQRVQALNLFINDIYHKQHILQDKIIPAELIHSCPAYLELCKELDPPCNIWAHINGVDLIRDLQGQFYVLEDNLRCPSGVSYVLENRAILKRTFPTAFKSMKIRPVGDYPERLLEALQSLQPNLDDPNIVILTPGIYNSAYFEHSYLAKQMGVPLVEGLDLVVQNNYVYAKTTQGLEKVDIIYRRIDDDFLDPEVLRADSLLGVRGLMRAYQQKHVTIVNAPGAGIADDKVIYAYVPKIIQYYLQEEPILPNVPTYVCVEPKQRQYVLEHIQDLVIKPANQSGGEGVVIGELLSKKAQIALKEKIMRAPRDFIAQPKMNLSRAPTIIGDELKGRHIDFRPYIISGKSTYVLPGGLTRVALRENSLIVNSSQGGGSKDTWVLSQ